MQSTADRIIAELKRDGRASVSELSSRLNLSRATIRAHMERMAEDGTILGYTVVLAEKSEENSIKGIVTIGLVGGTIERVVGTLRNSRAVKSVHTTHGSWDVVMEFAVATPRELDDLLAEIREIDGVERTDTSVYLRQRMG